MSTWSSSAAPRRHNPRGPCYVAPQLIRGPCSSALQYASMSAPRVVVRRRPSARLSRHCATTPQTCTAGHPGSLTPSRWQWRYYMCRGWWWSTSMTRVRRQGKASGSSGRLG